jgi:pimeloyl-ACP methyl ester carboxylesterase
MNPDFSRRRWLSTAPLAIAATASGCATGQSSVSPKSTFVLVHGAWHGSWCYSRVAALLQGRGHTVHSISLTGLGERSHLLTNTIRLQTHIDDVVNLVRWHDLERIVLVGHSYGGMVITGAAEAIEPKIKAIVYLDAFVPTSGQSLLSMASPESRQRTLDLAAKSGGHYVDPVPAKVFMVNVADQAWVDAKCTPQPLLTFQDPVPVAVAYDRVKVKHYVRAARYPSKTFDDLAATLARRQDWTVTRLAAGHDLMIDSPEDVSKVLEAASLKA